MPSINGGSQMNPDLENRNRYGVSEELINAANADTERWIDRLIKIEYQDDKCRLIFEDGDFFVPPVLVQEDYFTTPIGVELFGQGYGHEIRGLRIQGELVYYSPPQPKLLPTNDVSIFVKMERESREASNRRAEKSSLKIEVGKAYTDGNKTMIIVSKVQENQAPSVGSNQIFPYVSHTGCMYAEDGASFAGVPPLIMEWKLASETYCDENIRGYELLQKHGGDWLGTVREWIQCNAINGERVTWGSHEQLQLRGLSVHELEHLAARVAAAGINQFARQHYLLNAVKKARTHERGE